MTLLSTPPRAPTWWKQLANAACGLVLLWWLFRSFRHYVYWFPITIESAWQIALAELNRQKNIRRVRSLTAGERRDGNDGDGNGDGNGDAEKATGPDHRTTTATRCLASVVGFREEPSLFRKCLQSYVQTPGLEVMLVGIDGDEVEDMQMVEIAEEVFPTSIIKIHLDEPYGPLAVHHAQAYLASHLGDKSDLGDDRHRSVNTQRYHFEDISRDLMVQARQYAVRMVYEEAVATLRAHQALKRYESPHMQAICIYQPHICKKDIMFTNMVFSLALGQYHDIEYLWTSDSDTWVYPDTLFQTIGCMSANASIGGSCCALSIHNEGDNFLAGLGSAAYWSELAITRGQTGAVDAVDCQPGPCAAFRLAALEPILLEWYTQTSIGIKTVVNEDRHLTTRLLLNGWKVTFNTSALAATDTPTTLLRWLLQQLRWARATHLETFSYPLVYSLHSPVLFVTAMRRFYGPLLIGIFTVRYVLTGYTVRAYSLHDLLLRVLLCTAYNLATNREKISSVRGLVLSQLFYQLPLPGIMAWSTLTVWEGGWGTRMRSQSEAAQQRKRAGREHLAAITAVTAWMAFVAAALARYVWERWVDPSGAVAATAALPLLPLAMLLASGSTMLLLFRALLK